MEKNTIQKFKKKKVFLSEREDLKSSHYNHIKIITMSGFGGLTTLFW